MPALAHQPVDLFKLFHMVILHGGYSLITSESLTDSHTNQAQGGQFSIEDDFGHVCAWSSGWEKVWDEMAIDVHNYVPWRRLRLRQAYQEVGACTITSRTNSALIVNTTLPIGAERL